MTMRTPSSKPAPRPYTDEDRKRLLAPINIGKFGGKSWGGSFPANRDTTLDRHSVDDRYGYATDWADLDSL